MTNQEAEIELKKLHDNPPGCPKCGASAYTSCRHAEREKLYQEWRERIKVIEDLTTKPEWNEPPLVMEVRDAMSGRVQRYLPGKDRFGRYKRRQR